MERKAGNAKRDGETIDSEDLKSKGKEENEKNGENRGRDTTDEDDGKSSQS